MHIGEATAKAWVFQFLSYTDGKCGTNPHPAGMVFQMKLPLSVSLSNNFLKTTLNDNENRFLKICFRNRLRMGIWYNCHLGHLHRTPEHLGLRPACAASSSFLLPHSLGGRSEAQAIRTLPTTWETQTELQTPGFTLAWPQLPWGTWEIKQWMEALTFCALLSLCVPVFQIKWEWITIIKRESKVLLLEGLWPFIILLYNSLLQFSEKHKHFSLFDFISRKGLRGAGNRTMRWTTEN